MSTAEKAPSLPALLEQSKAELQKALGNVMNSDRFARLMLTEWRTNAKLQECSPQSILATCMVVAQMGLEIGSHAGEAYIIPRWNKKTNSYEAVPQWGYQGLLKLVRRSEEIKDIDTGTVYENDEFECEKGEKPSLRHRMKFPRGKPVLYYAYAHLMNGGFLFEVMEIEEIDYIRTTYGNDNSDAWEKSYSQMARKTVLRRLIKLLPKSTQLKEALEKEEAEEKVVIDVKDRKPELVGKVAALPRPPSDQEREAAWEELEKLYTECSSLKISTDDLPTKAYDDYTTQEIFACLGVVRERIKNHRGATNGSGHKNP